MKKTKEVKLEQIAETEIEFPKLEQLNTTINSLKNTNISVESIISLVKLKLNLKKLIEEQNTAIKELLAGKYALELVPSENGAEVFSFKGHEKEKEIIEEHQKLATRKVKITAPTKFMTMAELVGAAEGLPIGLLAEVSELLVKD